MRLIIIGVFVFLTACANTVPKYSDSEIASGGLAYIKSNGAKAFSSEFCPSIHSIYDINRKEVARMGYMNLIKEIYLEPGQYILVLLCDRGNSFAHPSIGVTLKPGKRYEIFCQVADKSKGFLGFEKIDSLSAQIEETSTGNEQ